MAMDNTCRPFQVVQIAWDLLPIDHLNVKEYEYEDPENMKLIMYILDLRSICGLYWC